MAGATNKNENRYQNYMTDYENINALLDEIKNCQANDIGKYFSSVIRQFRFLPKDQRNDLAQSFCKWANENKESAPLKFSYAEFLLGLYHFINEEHEVALRHLSQARKQFEEQGDDEGLGISSMLIGATYRTMGNFQLALKVLWEAFHLLKSSGRYPTFLAATANSMANINFELHNYDEAISMFNITLEESEKENDFYFGIYALQGLGKVSMQQGKWDEAKDYFERALKLATEKNHPMHKSTSLTELARYYFKLGDLKQSEELDRQALLIREQHQMAAGSITNCLNLAEVYMKQSLWDEALKILDKGLALAEQIKVKPKIYQVHFLLSQIYQSMNEWQKSLEHYKIYHSVRQQVEEEDNARKLADAKLIFEAEQTKKENIIIKKQKAEIQKKNIELQETIDELTLTRVSRKAKAITLVIAIVLFVGEDFILGFVLRNLPSDNYFISLVVKMVIIFSLAPINGAIERYLLRRVIKKKKREEAMLMSETELPAA